MLGALKDINVSNLIIRLYATTETSSGTGKRKIQCTVIDYAAALGSVISI